MQSGYPYPYHYYYPYPHPMDPYYTYHPYLTEPPFIYQHPLPASVKMEECKKLEQKKAVKKPKNFKNKLKIRTVRYKAPKKFWTEEEQATLLRLKKRKFTWPGISKQIKNASWQTCRRRYFQLQQEKQKWSPALKIEQEREEVQQIQEKAISEEFFQIFQEQLKQKRKEEKGMGLRQIKKFWTKEECDLLIQMKNQNFEWSQISKRIPNASQQVCKRKHYMLTEEKEKWPPELDEEIKHIYNNANLNWNEKLKQLREKFPQTRNYSSSMIKNRYLQYLKEEVNQQPWTFEEDMTLVRMKKGKKQWKQITEVLSDRTEPQIQNRYYNHLREIERKAERRQKQNKAKLARLNQGEQC